MKDTNPEPSQEKAKKKCGYCNGTGDSIRKDGSILPCVCLNQNSPFKDSGMGITQPESEGVEVRQKELLESFEHRYIAMLDPIMSKYAKNPGNRNKHLHDMYGLIIDPLAAQAKQIRREERERAIKILEEIIEDEDYEEITWAVHRDLEQAQAKILNQK